MKTKPLIWIIALLCLALPIMSLNPDKSCATNQDCILNFRVLNSTGDDSPIANCTYFLLLASNLTIEDTGLLSIINSSSIPYYQMNTVINHSNTYTLSINCVMPDITSKYASTLVVSEYLNYNISYDLSLIGNATLPQNVTLSTSSCPTRTEGIGLLVGIIGVCLLLFFIGTRFNITIIGILSGIGLALSSRYIIPCSMPIGIIGIISGSLLALWFIFK